jgi:hypothetical protein
LIAAEAPAREAPIMTMRDGGAALAIGPSCRIVVPWKH